MYRNLYKKLVEWKNEPKSKPLIVKGARQVGKTYLILEFAKKEFDSYVYINFEKEESMKGVFEGDIDPKTIIDKIEKIKQIKINKNTLIIFDEVQELKRALASLKYFNEEANEYKIICSGSNMGIALHEGTSFPVGKVKIINMYPMTYDEFLLGIGQEKLVNIFNGDDKKLLSSFSNDFIQYLRLYYFIGGMPEVIEEYKKNNSLLEAQNAQHQIIEYYKEDFSKHLEGKVSTKINIVYDSIASQLAKENKKFIYGVIKNGARAKDYEFSLNYLKDIGLIHFVYRISKPGYPLEFYRDLSAFKIYVSDIGLLSCMCNIDPISIIGNNNIFSEYKGALSEQYVLQQLVAKYNYDGFYYSNETSTGEVDFLYQYKGLIIPVEVKAEENLQAKSLKNYYKKFCPQYCIRTSMKAYRKEETLINVPLYDIGNMNKYIE